MNNPRPGWWRPLARRRWDREEAARVVLQGLLRMHPGLAEGLERIVRMGGLTLRSRGEEEG